MALSVCDTVVPLNARINVSLGLSYIQTVIGATRAKARTHFQRLNGTSKLVPFPFAEKSEFFRELFSH